MRYYIIAGEASGDLHGSNLIKGLISEDAAAELRFFGGDLMQQAAGDKGLLVKHYKEGAVMGIGDVLKSAGKLSRNLKICKADILDYRPDVVVLIDYPGFNIKIAKFCHSHDIKVFYYIAPKTWASRASRNRKLRKWVDQLFIVFPFERDYFSKQRIPYIYKGNPLIDAVDSHTYIRSTAQPYIALLAGSRKGEISRMMPVCMEVVDKLAALPQYAGYQFIIAGAPARSAQDYETYISGRDNVSLVFGQTLDILRFADAALINSGTASLEAVLTATPQVVGWSTSAFTYFIAKYILRVTKHVRYISLGNLCIDKLAFKELIQDDFRAENVSEELRRLIEDQSYRQAMLSNYAEIRASLGGSGASSAVAKEMVKLL